MFYLGGFLMDLAVGSRCFWVLSLQNFGSQMLLFLASIEVDIIPYKNIFRKPFR